MNEPIPLIVFCMLFRAQFIKRDGRYGDKSDDAAGTNDGIPVRNFTRRRTMMQSAWKLSSKDTNE